ncbi:uncharacterized protein EV422DRAFT_358800 [Fimicolochytrium jonesii]|uniref:uncharacterized protein n=1 Tax=Fimicolochytrium jonesii TaxID=1396493 RepID=UPI0022FDB8F3|nr:uncharacterized protein EV422DRAFT_358800 [Fimicolochytrium jonesii]KAI8823517.1 hypothetical protein EV422DRAFT_358800 [Fimicolochytrium jonesii]
MFQTEALHALKKAAANWPGSQQRFLSTATHRASRLSDSGVKARHTIRIANRSQPTPRSTTTRWSRPNSSSSASESVPYPEPIPSHTPQPRATGLRLIARRSKEGVAFVGRFKKTIFELFLWMVCGSLALELKWMRRDFAEYKETVDVKARKLRKEIEALKRELRPLPADTPKAPVKASRAVEKATSSTPTSDVSGSPTPSKKFAIY